MTAANPANLAARLATLPEVQGVTDERQLLSHIAELVHNGGLADLSESDVLRAVRRLTCRHWSRAHGAQGTARVSAALAALLATTPTP